MTVTFVTLCLFQIARFTQIWVGLTRDIVERYRYNRMKSGLRWSTQSGPTERMIMRREGTSRFVLQR